MDRFWTRLAVGGVLIGALAMAACSKAPSGGSVNAPIATNSPPANMASATPDQLASTPDAADAKAFLEGLYAHYKTSKDNTFQPFDANAKEVLDADTIALMKADQKALKGDLGEIDGDWLCDCQDFESITATIAVQSATATAAKATSDFHDTPAAGGSPKHDTFDLVKTPAGWRIHDIGTADQPSLRKVLTDEIAGLKSGKVKPDSGD
jgi:hypothetical protein